MSKLCSVRLAHAVALVACLAALASGARADVGKGTIEISFSATSTLHDFEGNVPAVAFAIEPGPSGAWGGDVEVPVAAIDTGIDRRDQNLRAWLDAAQYPRIRGRFRDVDPERARASRVLPFLLRICNVERPVQATVSHWQQDDRTARFDAEFDVLLHDYSLEAPSVLFVHVDDRVHVTVHVTLERT
jgi:polyisoprenoid-binding protein YceI